MFKLLYNDELAPITSSIGFLNSDFENAARGYEAWMGGLQNQRGGKLLARRTSGALREALGQLLPLTDTDIRRSLLVPTNSSWVAYFDNALLGTNASPVAGHLATVLGCRALSITAIAEERESERQYGKRDAATIFELYESHTTTWLNLARSITMMNDGKWIFELNGDPLPFEEQEQYKQRRIKDRFTLEMLDRYLRALGVSAFDENFYLPAGTQGVMFEKLGAMPKSVKEYGLEQAFARFS